MSTVQKKVIVIGAVSQDGVYGLGTRIPWRIPEEMQHFKEQTIGHTVLMGRGTWESLPPKFRPLPHRDNMVITNTPDYVAEGATVYRSIEQGIKAAKTEIVFCIGGHDIWYHAMSLADEAFITEVHKNFWANQPDVRLAEELLDPLKKWEFQEGSPDQRYECEIPFTIHHWMKGRSGGGIRRKEEVQSYRE